MRIASYNIENIFHRDAGLIKTSVHESVTAWVEEFETLLCKGSRDGHEISRMRELSFLLGFHRSSLEPYVVMRRKAGKFFLRKRSFEPEHRAGNANGWNGWVKLASRPILEEAIRNKARVIAEVDADILVLQEVEDRQALIDFNAHYLKGTSRFSKVFLIPGNDQKGRDLGLLVKPGYEIEAVRSHSNQVHKGVRVFDKDLQEYDILTPSGEKISLLSTHLCEPSPQKAQDDQVRRVQAELIGQIYTDRAREGKQVVLAGTFNTVSYCDSLSPILRNTDLKAIKKHPSFNVEVDCGKDAGYFSLGAYRMGVNIRQKDYLLCAPSLFKRIRNCGLHRKGVWPEKKAQWKTYPSVWGKGHQASAHPALWVDL